MRVEIRGSRRHTIVLSDVHLGEATSSAGEWLRYRQRRWFPDDDFRGFVDAVLGQLDAGDELEVVFGGDCVEFEAPRTSMHGDHFESTDRHGTEEHAVETMARVAADHPTFIEAIAKVVATGHTVRFVVGNHDAALTFPGVQQALRAAIAAERDDGVHVHPWFYQSDDGIHVEHGHQYDTYCSFRDPLRPLDANGRVIHPTVGSLAFRHLVSRMGYFNAYDDRSFMLSVPRYLAHWARYYLFSRRSLAATWFVGALVVVREVIRHRPARRIRAALREEAAVARAAYALARGIAPAQVTRHAELFVEPADADPHRVVREFRLDHAALAVVGVAGIVTSAFSPKVGLAMVVGAFLVGVAQELIRPRAPLHEGYRHVDRVAREVADIYRARAVIFGHTHQPHAEVEREVLYANTGSWAPAPDGPDAPKPSTKGRPFVWLRRPKGNPAAPLEGGLYRYAEGELRPEVEIAVDIEGTQPPAIAPVTEADAVALAIPTSKDRIPA